MSYRALFALLLGFTLLSGCANPNKIAFKKGRYNFLKQNYGQAFQQLKKPARSGYPEAQYAIGYMYTYGLGTPQDEKAGAFWINQSAKSGYSKAKVAQQALHIEEKHQQRIRNKKRKKQKVISILPRAKKSSFKGKRYTATEQRLLSTSPRFYTIQLMGDYHLSRVMRFIRRHHLKSEVEYYKTRRHGKTWYNLIYGMYPTTKIAAYTIADMPASLKKTKPWIKSLKIVQREIKH